MKRRLDKQLMTEWVKSVGSPTKASEIVKQKLKCSKSKADKIVGCRYPSVPQPLEQMALADLLGTTSDLLYPEACRLRSRAAS